MALLLPKYKLAYVGPGKVGTNSIMRWLMQYGAKRVQGGWIHAVKRIPEDYRLLVSVRNPYTRVPSCWAYMKRKHRTELDFSDWLRQSYGRERMGSSCAWNVLKTTMAEHLRPVMFRISCVVHLESVRSELVAATKSLGMEWQEAIEWHRNPDPVECDSMRYSQGDAEVIGEKSKEDFDVFGYSPEPLADRLK